MEELFKDRPFFGRPRAHFRFRLSPVSDAKIVSLGCSLHSLTRSIADAEVCGRRFVFAAPSKIGETLTLRNKMVLAMEPHARHVEQPRERGCAHL